MDHKWWTLVAVCTATFMLLLDITVVNVALPAIERDLNADLADLQWVVDAYALTLAALLLTGGSLADRVGRRRIFVIGLVVFTVASVLCGLATSPTGVNLARALQGVGGAFMFATSLALLASAYSGRDRGTALGLWGATTGAAVAVGPLVGGVLTEGIGRGGDLLRQLPSFGGASIAAFVLSAAMFAMFLYLTLYIQNILGYSALESGIRFMPVTLLSFAVAPVSGRLAERLGVRWFIAGGLALVGTGLLLMGGLEPGDDWTALLAGFLVAGGGIGLVNPALATAAIGVVDPRRSGMASGIHSTFRQVGIATGIAAWGAIFRHVVRDEFVQDAARAGVRGIRRRGDRVADFIAFGGARRSGNPQLARLGEQAFVAGLNRLLLLAGLLAFAGALLTALLIRPADLQHA